MAYGKWSVKWSPIYGQWVVRSPKGHFYARTNKWPAAYRTAYRKSRTPE